MNKQRSVPAELVAIAAVIVLLSLLVWNITPFSSSTSLSPKSTDASNTADAAHAPPKDANWIKGKELFKSNCAACHNPLVAVTGPALKGVTKRWEDAGSYQNKTGNEWLHLWIKDWNKAVASGYPYAVSIEKYNETHMNVFPNLSDTDIDNILKYVESSETAKAGM